MQDGANLQDSVVAGDLHVGDIQHNTTNIDQSTTIDKSTKINLPSMDEVAKKAAGAANMVGKSAAVVGKSSKEALGGVGLFLKSLINRILLFATVTVVVVGFLVYNGNIDVNQLVKDLN